MSCSKTRKQCKGCPWRVSNDPRAIPNGLKRDAAELLQKWSYNSSGLGPAFSSKSGMSCHESPIGPDALPCVGWLTYELGEGNNIALRMQVRSDTRLQGWMPASAAQRSMDEMLEAMSEG